METDDTALVAADYGIALPPTNFGDKIDPDEDLKGMVPWLYFKHAQSKYDEGEPGNLVLSQGDEKTAIYVDEVFVPVVLVLMDKFWVEHMPWKDKQKLAAGEYPKRAYDMESMRELEAESDYKIIPMSSCFVLIQHTPDSLITHPDEVDIAFPFELDGKRYAAAKFEAKFQGYDGTFKTVQRWLAANPHKDYAFANWSIRSKAQRNRDGDEWHTPELRVMAGAGPGPEALTHVARSREALAAMQAKYAKGGDE